MKGVVENNLPLKGSCISGFPGYGEKASVNNKSLSFAFPHHLLLFGKGNLEQFH